MLSDPRNAALSSPQVLAAPMPSGLSDPRNAALSSPEAAQSCADASLSDPRNAALSSQSARRIEGTCSCQTHGMRPSRHLVAKLREVDLVVRPTECGPLVTRTRSAH